MKKLKNKLLLLSSVALVSAPVLGVSAQISAIKDTPNADGEGGSTGGSGGTGTGTNSGTGGNAGSAATGSGTSNDAGASTGGTSGGATDTNASGVDATSDQALQTKKAEYKTTIEGLARKDDEHPFLSAAQIAVYKEKADGASVTGDQVDQFLKEANEVAALMLTLLKDSTSELFDKLTSSTRFETKVSDATDAKTYKEELTEAKNNAQTQINQQTKSATTLSTKDQVQGLIDKFVDSYNKGVVSILDLILNGNNPLSLNSVITSYLKELLKVSKEDLSSSTKTLKPENLNAILTVDSAVDQLVQTSVEVKKFVEENQDLKANVANILGNQLISKEDKDKLNEDYNKLSLSLDSQEDVKVGEEYVKDPESFKKNLETLTKKYTELKQENEKTAPYNAVLTQAIGLNELQVQYFATEGKKTADNSQDPSEVETFKALVKNVNDEMMTLRKNLKEYEPKLKEFQNSDKLTQENKDSISSVLRRANDQLTNFNKDAQEIQSVASNVAREYSKALELTSLADAKKLANLEDPKPTYYEYIVIGAVSSLLLLAGLFMTLFSKSKKAKAPKSDKE
ncbi:hypothetical protein NPA08_01315 [Mycoplasmopsis citelli]|uniref:hypothetical protein n=1 Tax=Mycoplasmopsis citelli TaxID=171281 RepID=UPI0021144F64|nr:hypothetical protein [Mycoplasmopsis citelli]UUD36456.1 hypothetical protein NPA08_01315 [Mycoplasmopsis citelli]